MHLAAGNLYLKFKWHCVGSGLGPILRDWVNWRHFRLSFLSARFFNLFVRYTENNFKKLWSFRSANVSAPNRRNMPLSLLWRRLLVIFFSGVTWRDICCVTHAKLGFMQNDLTLRKQLVFCDATAGFRAKWSPRTNTEIIISPDDMSLPIIERDSASNWLKIWPVRGTTQIWVVMDHQRGISLLSSLHYFFFLSGKSEKDTIIWFPLRAGRQDGSFLWLVYACAI